jgi:hypothetical protein
MIPVVRILKSHGYNNSTLESTTYSHTITVPAKHRKKPYRYINAAFEFYERCGHEHDCCGCVYMAAITRTKKINRRNWNVHVTFYRNL